MGIEPGDKLVALYMPDTKSNWFCDRVGDAPIIDRMGSLRRRTEKQI